jgi:hypothetical protein
MCREMVKVMYNAKDITSGDAETRTQVFNTQIVTILYSLYSYTYLKSLQEILWGQQLC